MAYTLVGLGMIITKLKKMRELKFRAWNTDTKEWVSKENNQSETNLNYDTNFLVRWHVYDLQQYTGLEDRNYVDVYEGDIICNPKADEPEDEGWEVGFNMGSWECVNVRLRREDDIIDSYNLYDFGMSGMEVIGNIYENPELLK